MKQEQTEQVLLILSNKNGRVVHIVNCHSDLIVEVRYTAYIDNVSDEDDLRVRSRENVPGQDHWVRIHAHRFVKTLRYLQTDETSNSLSVWDTIVKYKDSWFNLAVRPLKGGPACFVEHVVL
jgi:hypothetical protein